MRDGDGTRWQDTQLIAMNTYVLFRSNFGSSGVVWSSKNKGAKYDATVLFISEHGNYDDMYLNYLEKQRERLYENTTILSSDLPEIMYEYPSNPIDRAYLDSLQKDDSEQAQYTDFYNVPKSKVYVFFKMKAAYQHAKIGPYLFFGRFMVMPRLPGQDANKIRLKYYEPPLQAQLSDNQTIISKKIPAYPSTSSQSDVDSVISILSTLSRKQSKRVRRAEAAAAAAASRDSDELSDESDNDEVVDTTTVASAPAAPTSSGGDSTTQSPKKYRISKKGTTD